MLRFQTKSPVIRLVLLGLGIGVVAWIVMDVIGTHPRTVGAFAIGLAPFIAGALAYLAIRLRRGA